MDKESVKELFLMHQHEIYNFLVYFMGTRDVEDLVQEVFIKLLKSHYRLQDVTNSKSLLFTMARNIAIDYRRKKRIQSLIPIDSLFDLASKDKTPLDHLESSEEKDYLFRLLSKLKPAYRDVIILRRIQHLSIEETAQVLGWNETKVKTTLHRALKKLKEEIGFEEGVFVYEQGSSSAKG